MKNDRLKAGIAGVGRFGSRHLDKWIHFDDAKVVGFYDTDPRVQERIQAERNIPYLPLEDLLERIDVLDIVTPGSTHYAIARTALQAGKHVFVEKPFAEFEDQARELAGLAEAKQVLIGVGHIEHFNPVFRALKEQMHEVPKTLEAYRQGPFLAGVGVDISIILELMIHDIELATRLIPYPLKSVRAEGEMIHSDKIDRARAVLTFGNGSVATLFASRAEDSRRRELICRCDSGTYTANFMERRLEVPGDKSVQHFEPNDAMAEELHGFVQAVRTGRKPYVHDGQGLHAVSVANAIENAILK